MVKLLLWVPTALWLLSGCGSVMVSKEKNAPDFSATTLQFLGNAQSAIVAYQNGDKHTWERLVCQRPSKQPLDHVQKFIGTYESVRLVSLKDKWSAANKPPSQSWIEVVFEGIASNYPMPDHKMAVTFTDIGEGCLYLMF